MKSPGGASGGITGAKSRVSVNSRGLQFATLAARERIPASYTTRDVVVVGGLMSYGTDLTDVFQQVGIYAGRILKSAPPGDLPVLQETRADSVRFHG